MDDTTPRTPFRTPPTTVEKLRKEDVPRVGGVTIISNKEVAWVGGGNTSSNRMKRMKSKFALRPQDPKGAFAVEEMLCRGFSKEADHLGTTEEIKQKEYTGSNLRDWMKNLQRQFLKDG